MAARVRELPLFHDLQQHVVNFRVSFLELVKHHDRIGAAAQGFCELTCIVVADIARRRTHQSRRCMPFHKLGHVELDGGVFAAKHELGQRLGELGLADAGGAKENERADGPARILQPGACAAHGARDGSDGFILPNDAGAQFVFHL